MSSTDNDSTNRYLIEKDAEQAARIRDLERDNRELQEELHRLTLVKVIRSLYFICKNAMKNSIPLKVVSEIANRFGQNC